MVLGANRTQVIKEEMARAELGDARLNRRLGELAESLARSPSASFPRSARGSAALEAAYRFLNNPRVSSAEILRPHAERTFERMRASSECLVVHDTTMLAFPGESERDGLGPIKGGAARGFFAHVGLALADAESRTPLGVVGLETWAQSRNKKKFVKRKVAGDDGRASDRWRVAVEKFERSFEAPGHAVHVMDREGDMYFLLGFLVENGHRYVIRSSHDRLVSAADAARLHELVERSATRATRRVALSRRKRSRLPGNRRSNPARSEREAKLRIGATRATFRRPAGYRVGEGPNEIELNVVWVREDRPPSDEPAVEWTLLTSEPIATTADLLAVVDMYRARWTIEELFKALKTGCAIEKRQLESYDALVRALAIFLPIAWQLLALRHGAERHPDALASGFMTDTRLRLLAALLRMDKNYVLPDTPTVEQALLGIAHLGGHIKYNGAPGWIVLGRGFDSLLQAERGLLALAPEM